jgi:DNA (cytosine-5)-methyltransferase 1
VSLRIGSLCSGYGGLDLAVMDALGGHVVWHAQYEPPDKNGKPDVHQWPSQILAHRFPGVPNHGDITAIDWAAVEPVDVLTAGWPCQDMSLAGLGAGLMPGTRSGLWYHVAAAIAALRPSIVVLENVRSLTSAKAHSNVELCAWCLGDIGDEPALRALGAVLGDLADIGFDAEWLCLPASDVGAPHQRWRAFVLAWPAADADDLIPGDDGELPAGRNALRQRVRDDAAGRGAAIADAEGDGRHQGRTEPAGIQRRPDAALGGGHAAADADEVGRERGRRPRSGGGRTSEPRSAH